MDRIRSVPAGLSAEYPRRSRCAQRKIPAEWCRGQCDSCAAERFARGPVRCAQGDGRFQYV